MSGYGGLGGYEGHGGVPAGGHGYFSTPGRAGDIADELRRTRGPRKPRGPKRRWWRRLWRRDDPPGSAP
ncbi:MAG: hypothetical protein ACAH81_15315 [Actinomycetota bacterium]